MTSISATISKTATVGELAEAFRALEKVSSALEVHYNDERPVPRVLTRVEVKTYLAEMARRWGYTSDE
ncbi:hypothetical protein [Microbacterium sp. cf332]|uniref:hypothetical protein n=1 Tax=Microbacterium sp. cf332 TaxID=1761804 RepID=UPI000B89378A|nr:hypothetical protein [Microbacterium sp. cf332]